MRFPFEHSYSQLPSHFFARVGPTPVAAPQLVRLNMGLCDDLGLDSDWLSGPEGLAVLAGNHVPEEAMPIALAYAGHQFGYFVPQLGDGRAVLLGEVIDSHRQRRDIQLKGSGQTPFSRRGDGRAALGPVLREYIVSEAMHALGVPTTRTLAAVTTGQRVARETFLPGAILTRVASSHVRVGTFQFLAARGDEESVRLLADYVIARHYPAARDATAPYLALLQNVIAAQARLIARWMLIGFIHGVMNTDNMSIAGETIDYGPCAFMDSYDPATVFSAVDAYGRYAYGNQPMVAQWNLARLAETLLPFFSQSEEEALTLANAAIGAFRDEYEAAFLAGARAKLGLFSEQEGDLALFQSLLEAMHRNKADFTLTFRALSDAAGDPSGEDAVRELFANPADFDAWAALWRARISQESQTATERREAMRRVNPRYIARNHAVEAVIDAAVEREDFGPFEALLHVLAKPYEDQPDLSHHAQPPLPHERVLRTFCGT